MHSLNLAQSVHEHASRNPSQLALSVGGVDFSYRALADSAGRVSGWLGSASRVGILAARSLDAYLGILGTCWAGGAYVPLSPRLPPERLMKLLEITALDALVVDSQGLKLLAKGGAAFSPRRVLFPTGGSVMLADREHGRLTVAGSHSLQCLGSPRSPKPLNDDNLAYIIFTSGTTGTPKGVMVTAGSVFQFLAVMEKRYCLTPDDRVSQASELTFDVSVFEMFLSWRLGASVHVVPPEQLMAPLSFIRQKELTVWSSVPSIAAFMRRMKMLKPGVLPSLTYSVFAGEALPFSLAEIWQSAATNSVVDNMYGPTEATVYCLGDRFVAAAEATTGRNTVPIGRPIEGIEAAILNSSLKWSPDNEQGQLAIAGKQLARGYFNDAAETASRFPVIDGRRWYLTGDLVSRDSYGVYHYLGRIDHQIKVLGQRVELDEVEAHLRAATGSDSVAAVAWPIEDGSAAGIVGFVAGCEVSLSEVRDRLKARLPRYMVPRHIYTLEVLPLNSSGKIDRPELTRWLNDGSIPKS